MMVSPSVDGLSVREGVRQGQRDNSIALNEPVSIPRGAGLVAGLWGLRGRLFNRLAGSDKPCRGTPTDALFDVGRE
ncbi:hypothetical protein VAWG006_13070 [Aeromonas enteropelogenes]|nr:hypothetical protein VAWG006_13070 [Aeromonas enteropelogenes]BEE21219.1 hypothetical protein VAWG007_13140 [Aeromonas enteropelogenes]